MSAYPPPVVWALFAVAGLVTFALRYSFVRLLGRVEAVPPRLATALRYVPPAVLAALVAPVAVGPGAPGGAGAVGPAVVPRTAAVAVAAVVAWRTESAVATIAAGMGALWLIGAL